MESDSCVVWSQPQFWLPRVFRPGPKPTLIELGCAAGVYMAIHYEGRSKVCPGVGCELCCEGMIPRAYVFLSLVAAPRWGIWQVTPDDYEHLQRLLGDAGLEWEDAILRASRKTSRSRVQIELHHERRVRKGDAPVTSQIELLRGVLRLHGVFAEGDEILDPDAKVKLCNAANRRGRRPS